MRHAVPAAAALKAQLSQDAEAKAKKQLAAQKAVLDKAAGEFMKVVGEYRGVDMSERAADMAAEGPAPVAGGDPRKSVKVDGQDYELRDGSVVIASITSCTNTSNPYVMIGAGLVARKARALGLDRKPWVKTSLAPGSQVVTEYLKAAGLQDDLDAIGFNLVGYQPRFHLGHFVLEYQLHRRRDRTAIWRCA